MPISQHKATIGRKLWVWMDMPAETMDNTQAFDATVIYVYADGRVALRVTTHFGGTLTLEDIEIHDPSPNPATNGGDCHGAVQPYATWMPYQKKKHEEEKKVGAGQ